MLLYCRGPTCSFCVCITPWLGVRGSHQEPDRSSVCVREPARLYLSENRSPTFPRWGYMMQLCRAADRDNPNLGSFSSNVVLSG